MYENADFDNFANACINSGKNVKYTMSHDEIGNFDGTRNIAKLMVPSLNLQMVLDEEDYERADNYARHKNKDKQEALDIVVSQKKQFAAEKLATKFQTGELDKYAGKDYDVFADEVLIPLGISYNSNMFYDTVRNAFNTAYEKTKMGQTLTYAIPGPKMVFQGDEKADLTPFRFFREFDSVKDEKYLYWEKGYQYGKPALEESKMGNIQYSKAGQTKCNDFERLSKDLNKLMKQNSAMINGNIIYENTVKHFDSKVIGIHTKDSETGNELFTVANINGNRYPNGNGGGKYFINLPQGQWVEILNTNDKKYGGNGKFMNEETINSNGNEQSPINLNTHCAIIFKRVG